MKKLIFLFAFLGLLTSCSKDKVDPDLTTAFVGTWKQTQIDGDYTTDYVWNFNRLTNNTVKISITSIESYKKQAPITTITVLDAIKVLDNRTLDFTTTSGGIKLTGTGVQTGAKLSIAIVTADGDQSYWELVKQ